LCPDGTVGRTRHYREGEVIWRPDDLANSIYFLVRGLAEVLLIDSDGREILLRIVEPKQAFGELCFCTARNGQRRNTARATAETQVIEISLDEFFEYLQKNLPALVSLVYTFCTRVSETEGRVEVLSQRSARQRLGRLLLQLALLKRDASKLAEAEVLVGTQHEQLAQMAAMSRPHVTLTMLNFRYLGIVRYGRNLPLKVNVPLLKRFLERGEVTRVPRKS
jgi:CRP-like cAMP-binding protein